MLFKRLSAWIKDAEGEALPEYQTREIDENTVECWIPSIEGTSFQIEFGAEKDARPTYDVYCAPYLDGIKCSCSMLSAEKIAKGDTRIKRGHFSANSVFRPYCFGKRKLTDNEDIAPLSREVQKDLNAIRVELNWGHIGQPTPLLCDDIPDAKPLHEKMAKKGHSGSAELGKPTAKQPNGWSNFKLDPNVRSLTFVFRYASQDWLQAREITPYSQQSRSSSTPERGTKKRPRSATPDVIDIDDLETDDDEIVVVKHLIPAPVVQKKKPRRVKDEDGVRPKLEL
ncbi:hypothetical protein BDV93DRAFT_609407 [Ceratobasidium sp. AG-I]|nr:hypothetical protein BDV93DRAFT_609407 [Ceratobasidium sp. AG-I]